MTTDPNSADPPRDARHWRYSYRRNRAHPRVRASRTVRIMKVLLPAVALAVTGLAIAWTELLPGTDRFRIGGGTLRGLHISGMVVSNPRYVGTDSRNRSYQISAESAQQPDPTGMLVHLTEPKADILVSDDGWIALSARSGMFDTRYNRIRLSGEVTLLMHGGLQFMSESAEIDLHDGIVTGTRPVHGVGDAVSITAEGFRLDGQTRKVTFTGRTTASIDGPGRDAS